ncbi:MAG: DUF302 domain-containing protein [Melioribacteraceae bacterium]|jgi:uncharacterized protein (DUF302 family)|nr:DUF302 domain-containing protein [Melioribacteraceae bacterium]
MSYYFSKTLDITMDEAYKNVTSALQTEGFGIVTEFDVSNAFKNKLGIDYRPYKIVGACNPPFAKKAIDIDDKIGVMLPCNIIMQQKENGIEFTVIDPSIAMNLVGNPDINEIASEIKIKLKNVFDLL